MLTGFRACGDRGDDRRRAPTGWRRGGQRPRAPDSLRFAEAFEVFLVCAEVLRRSLCTTNQARGHENIVSRNTFQFFLQVLLQCFADDPGFGLAPQLEANTKPLARLLGMRTMNRWVGGSTLPSSV